MNSKTPSFGSRTVQYPNRKACDTLFRTGSTGTAEAVLAASPAGGVAAGASAGGVAAGTPPGAPPGAAAASAGVKTSSLFRFIVFRLKMSVSSRKSRFSLR